MAQGLFNLKQVNQAVRQGAWVAGAKPPAVDFLVVAGGGGAGASGPGGAGAGGVLIGNTPVVAGSAITVTIGAGGGGTSGSGAPGNGSNSVFGSQVAIGGGKGENNSVAAGSGGSGGGVGSVILGAGQGTANQGFQGGATYVSPGASSGGGGAGSVGQSPIRYNVGGQGGNGLGSVITGTMSGYGGGGAGSTGNTGTGTSPPGTAYGGGGIPASGNGGNGDANTGGGGSGAPSYTGGNGGSGIVIVSYPDVYAAPTATTGSPTVSTSGSGSLSFNGSTQSLTSPASSVYNFGTGNFTLEAWVYCTSFSNTPCIFDARVSGGAEPWALYINTSGQPYYYDGSVRNTTTSVSLNTWTHIAAVRNSGTLNIYINGVSGYSASNTTNITSTSTLRIAGAFSASYFPGFLSNARITNTAVYTANFTPSTTPLTAISGTQILLNNVSGAQFADGSSNAFVITTIASPTWNSSSPFATGLGYKNRVYKWTSSGSITF